MTPDTCPYCGAPSFVRGRNYIEWTCGSSNERQSPECARYVRTRISQLRRMADLIQMRLGGWRMILESIERAQQAAKG